MSHFLTLNEKRAYLAELFRSTDVTPADCVKIIAADNELYKLQLDAEAREKEEKHPVFLQLGRVK